MACSEDHGAIVDCEVLQGGCLKTGLREDLIYYLPTFGGLINEGRTPLLVDPKMIL